MVINGFMDGELECWPYDIRKKRALIPISYSPARARVWNPRHWAKKSRAIELWKLETRRPVASGDRSRFRARRTKRRRDYADGRAKISGRLSAFEAISRLIPHLERLELVRGDNIKLSA